MVVPVDEPRPNKVQTARRRHILRALSVKFRHALSRVGLPRELMVAAAPASVNAKHRKCLALLLPQTSIATAAP